MRALTSGFCIAASKVGPDRSWRVFERVVSLFASSKIDGGFFFVQ